MRSKVKRSRRDHHRIRLRLSLLRLDRHHPPHRHLPHHHLPHPSLSPPLSSLTPPPSQRCRSKSAVVNFRSNASASSNVHRVTTSNSPHVPLTIRCSRDKRATAYPPRVRTPVVARARRRHLAASCVRRAIRIAHYRFGSYPIARPRTAAARSCIIDRQCCRTIYLNARHVAS